MYLFFCYRITSIMNVSFPQLIFTSCKPSIFGLLLPYSFLDVYRHLHVYILRALQSLMKLIKSVRPSLFSTKHLLKLPWQSISATSISIRWVDLDGGERESHIIWRRMWEEQGWTVVPKSTLSYRIPCSVIWVTWKLRP